MPKIIRTLLDLVRQESIFCPKTTRCSLAEVLQHLAAIPHFLVGLGVGFAKKLQCGIWIWRFIHQQRGNYIYLINIILTFDITTTRVMYQMVYSSPQLFCILPYKQRVHCATIPTFQKISSVALQRSYFLGSSWVGLTV